ncbi:IS3 family transposase [Psychrobacter sp. H7-1]|uniref:IS3 family transposase n=1 Tax=Psychrobacter sp. H7-1 TaxID=1569265 RepID=UPI00191AC3FD|nr:IS3 family transposase [Psychrobacter sp. H7-1]
MPTEGKALTPELRRIQELVQQVKQLKLERYSKKGISSAGIRQSERIQIIQDLAEQPESKTISKSRLCDLFGIVRSSYYWCIKPASIDYELIKLKALVRQVFNDSRGSAGARTISNIVTQQHDIKLTRYKAGKLMKDMRLVSKQKKHSYKNKEQTHKLHDNMLNRIFTPEAPNQVWTGDVTYIRIKGGGATLQWSLTYIHAISWDSQYLIHLIVS